MVIDTSVILAILFKEPEALEFIEKLEQDPTRLMSAANVLESRIVVEARKGSDGGREFELFLLKARIEIIPFDDQQLKIAFHCWKRFGKGNHKAGLNFGDCFAYTLAKSYNEPLLFKGKDFIHTDVKLISSYKAGVEVIHETDRP